MDRTPHQTFGGTGDDDIAVGFLGLPDETKRELSEMVGVELISGAQPAYVDWANSTATLLKWKHPASAWVIRVYGKDHAGFSSTGRL